MNCLRLAVIGTGHLGRIHARLITQMPDVVLVGVCDPLPSAREQVAVDCGTVPYADHRHLLPRVDGAVIATPTRFHRDVALDFLNSGLPLLIEKPIASTIAEADELVDAARSKQTILQVGHIERFNPAFTAGTAHVHKPRYIEAIRASGFTGRSTDIGVVHDLMIHDIDLVLSLVDAPLVRVDAVAVPILGEKEDAAQARLEFADGCVANLSASRVSYSETPRRRMHVWSADRFVEIDFGQRSVKAVTPCPAVRRGEFDYNALSGDEKAGFKDRVFTDILRLEPVEVESRNALADELRDFADSIRQARAPRVTGLHGREALAVAEAVVESARSHRWQAEPQGPPILRGPHWHLSQPTRSHREAS